jgi:hypothetical protein
VYRSMFSKTSLPSGKEPPYPFDGRLRGPQNKSGHGGEEKISWPYQDLNSDPSVVQLIGSSYTDCAIPAQWTISNIISV